MFHLAEPTWHKQVPISGKQVQTQIGGGKTSNLHNKIGDISFEVTVTDEQAHYAHETCKLPG